MIVDYLSYPTHEGINKINEDFPILKELYLKLDNISRTHNSLSDFSTSINLNHWINLFNNRLNEVYLTYIFLIHTFNKGIPDDPYFISPGKSGKSITYFPNFKEENFYYKEIFDYYVDVFYYKFFSSFDLVYHLINIKYNFEIEENLDFKKNVGRKLKEDNNKLYLIIEKMRKSSVFSIGNNYRNNYTHNHPPTTTGYEISKVEQFMSIGIRDYTNSSSIKKNIEELLEEMCQIVEALKIDFEKN